LRISYKMKSNIEDAEKQTLPIKKTHTYTDGWNFFRTYHLIYTFHIIAAVIALVFGCLLLLCGSYANTGYIAKFALVNVPYPNITLINEDRTVSILQFLQLACWIMGFFLILSSMIVFYTILVFHQLMFFPKPWQKDYWKQVRKEADQILIGGKVRSKTTAEQRAYMNESQQKEMNKYYIYNPSSQDKKNSKIPT